VNHYWKSSGHHRYISPEGRDFKRLLTTQAKRNNFQLLEGDVEVRINWFKKGRERGDLDNILKVIMDSLNGIGYQDDSQVKSIIARMWEKTGNNGVEIQVLPISPEKVIMNNVVMSK
jgi:Holliday junction resolvase RusA-like endonuclease